MAGAGGNMNYQQNQGSRGMNADFMGSEDFMGSGASGAANHSSSENSIDISNHSVTMTIMEPSDSVVLRGHNCTIEIGAGNTISNLVITGHNNKVFSKSSRGQDVPQFGVVGSVEVMGHNNRIETIIANTLKVHGHNNRFQQVIYSRKDDFGICNQFHSCQQQTQQSASSGSGSHQAHGAPHGNHRNQAHGAHYRQQQHHA